MSNTQRRFLIVNDFVATRQMIASVLHDLGYRGYREAENGREALEILKRGGIDFVITGVEMPHIDGISLLKQIRHTEGMRLLPVIIVTSNGGRESIMQALALGADDYLIKPISGDALKASLGRACRKRGWH